MPASCPTASTTVLGLALTFDPLSPALPETLAILRAYPGLTLEEPHMPFAAVVLETANVRGDHAWLESLPAVRAVDVVFVEIVPESETDATPGARRRRSRDSLDDSPVPLDVPATDPDLLSFSNLS